MLDFQTSEPSSEKAHRPGIAGVMLLDDGSCHVVVVCDDCGLAWPVIRLSRRERPAPLRLAARVVRKVLDRHADLLRAIRLGPDAPDLRH